MDPHYECESCPVTRPLDFYVIALSPIELLQGGTSTPFFRLDSRGGFAVEIRHNATFLVGGSGPNFGQTMYRFDPSGRPAHAEREPSYRLVHNELFARARLDHAFGPADEVAVWPVLRWANERFEEVRR